MMSLASAVGMVVLSFWLLTTVSPSDRMTCSMISVESVSVLTQTERTSRLSETVYVRMTFSIFRFLYGVDGRSAVAMSLVAIGFSVVCIMYWKFWAGADVTCSSVESSSYLYTFCKVPSGRAASSNP